MTAGSQWEHLPSENDTGSSRTVINHTNGHIVYAVQKDRTRRSYDNRSANSAGRSRVRGAKNNIDGNTATNRQNAHIL